MNDLISRQAVLYAIVNNPSEEIRQQWIGRNSQEAYLTGGAHRQLEIIDLIDELPSAQPERKKGRWIRHDEVKNIYGGICIECSECGEKYVVQYIEDEKYCRNCGADMRGEEDE